MTMMLSNTVYREAEKGGGDAVPLVLVHAFPVDHRMWDECAGRIIRLSDARGLPAFPVWAPDTPGSGRSPVPDAVDSGPQTADGSYPDALGHLVDAHADLVRRAGYRRAVWVGLSMGGYVAIGMQRRHPDIMAGLALCDTRVSVDAPVARQGRLRCAEESLRTGGVGPVMHFAEPQPGDSATKRSPEFVATFTRWIRSQTPDGIAWRQRMAAGRPDMTDELPHVSVPAAVVSGERDPSSPPEAMIPLAEAMTGTDVRFTRVPDCGHFSAVERPDVVAGALVDLMARVLMSEARS